MKVRNVALIIFYDNKGRILLQDRRGISSFGAEWGFFGGAIEKGETPEQAVVRETREELSFDLKEYKYVLKYSYKIESINTLVKLNVFISPLKNISDFKQKEGARMKLFTLEEAEKLKMVSEGDIEMIRRLKKIL